MKIRLSDTVAFDLLDRSQISEDEDALKLSVLVDALLPNADEETKLRVISFVNDRIIYAVDFMYRRAVDSE